MTKRYSIREAQDAVDYLPDGVFLSEATDDQILTAIAEKNRDSYLCPLCGLPAPAGRDLCDLCQKGKNETEASVEDRLREELDRRFDVPDPLRVETSGLQVDVYDGTVSIYAIDPEGETGAPNNYSGRYSADDARTAIRRAATGQPDNYALARAVEVLDELYGADPKIGRVTRTGTYLTETGVESGTVSYDANPLGGLAEAFDAEATRINPEYANRPPADDWQPGELEEARALRADTEPPDPEDDAEPAGPDTEYAFRDYLADAIRDFDDSYDRVGVATESFAERGLMAHNEGLVVSFPDGPEYQLTIVRSR